MDLVDAVYCATRSFPKEEVFALSMQMRRAVVSIPSNLAEGCARRSVKEFAHFVAIAQGSLAELETQLLIAIRQRMLKEKEAEPIFKMMENTGKLLTKLGQSLRKQHIATTNN